MKVGAIEETITVSGETPIVDTQSVRRQVTVSNDVIASMPAARSYAGVMMLIPATTTQAGANLDIQVTPGMLVFGGAGGRTNEARIQVDGLNTGAAFNGAGVSSYVVDIGNAQEISMTTSGGLGEAEVGGPSFSIVPKTGGNSIKGTVYASNVTKGMVGDNYTQELEDRGSDDARQALQAVGLQHRRRRSHQEGQGLVLLPVPRRGQPPHDPGHVRQREHGRSARKWTYVEDTTRPAVAAGSWRNASHPPDGPADGAQQVQRVLGSADALPGRRRPRLERRLPSVGSTARSSAARAGASNPPCSATTAPEIGTYLAGFGQRVQQATWSSPMTNKLLLEAGFGTYWSQWGGIEHPGSNFTQLVGVTEQCTNADCASFGGIPDLQYRSGTYRQNLQGTVDVARVGVVRDRRPEHEVRLPGRLPLRRSVHLHERSVRRLPLQQRRAEPDHREHQLASRPTSACATTRSTGRIRRRSAASRCRARSATIARGATSPRSRSVRCASCRRPSPIPTPTACTAYNDITPRGGAAIDMFGNGKTSLKINVGRYLQAAQNGLAYGALRPSSRLQTHDDPHLERHEQELRSGLRSAELAASNGECSAIANSAFGTQRLHERPRSVAAQRLGRASRRLGLRRVSVQQEILPRVSVELGYNRRWLNNFTWDDNVLQATGDFKTFTVVAPTDSRLGDASGADERAALQRQPERVGPHEQRDEAREDAGGKYAQVYNGFLFNVSARPRNGLVFQGGFSTGTQRTDYCDVRAASPEYHRSSPRRARPIRGATRPRAS